MDDSGFASTAVRLEIDQGRVGDQGVQPIGPVEGFTKDQVNTVINTLLARAQSAGRSARPFQVISEALRGGHSADIVGRVEARTSYVCKVHRDPALVSEARLIKRRKQNTALPRRVRDAWPRVYAIHDRAPFAYLMEDLSEADGWTSLQACLFPKTGGDPSPDRSVRKLEAVLDVLFEEYQATIDKRMVSSIRQDFVIRIRDRLRMAESMSRVFRSRPLTINGEHCAPWKDSLGRIEALGVGLERFAPPFSTDVHGDSNPGNLFTRTIGSSDEVKLIDPKPFDRGDYLFDVAKITHAIEATGPIERSVAFSHEAGDPMSEATNALNYTFIRHPETNALVEACLARVAQFAEQHGDVRWRERYQLAMAANLLGLPANRFQHAADQRPLDAIALYAEGLRWLEKFCRHLPAEPRSADGGWAI